MGERGPARTPVEIVKLQGNPGHRKLTDITPPNAVKFDIIEMPEPTQALSGKAQQTWDRLFGPEVQAQRWIAPSDIGVATRYCVLTQLWSDAKTSLDIDGLTIMDDKGNIKLNPAFTAFNNLESNLQKAEKVLGLTPSARASLGNAIVSTEVNKSKLDKYLNKK